MFNNKQDVKALFLFKHQFSGEQQEEYETDDYEERRTVVSYHFC